MINFNRSAFVPTSSFVARSFNVGCIAPPAVPAKPGQASSTGIDSPIMKSMIQRKVDAFMKTNPTPCAPVSDPELFPSVNVTPKNVMGVNVDAYNLNGELMVCVKPATANELQTGTWYDAGKVPAMNM